MKRLFSSLIIYLNWNIYFSGLVSLYILLSFVVSDLSVVKQRSDGLVVFFWGGGLRHINFCRLFNAKSIFM